MSGGGHRHRQGKAADNKAADQKAADKKKDQETAGRGRSRKDEVSIADRLQGTGSSSRGTTPPTVLPGDPSAPAVAPASRRQMREQRAQHQKRARHRWLVTTAGIALVALVGAALVLWLSGRGNDAAPVATDTRTERTLTVTLADGSASATSGALMVYDPTTPTAGSVLIQSRLFVAGSTPEGVPFGETVLLGSVAAPGTSLADTLHVIVDDTWQMSNDMLSALVDAANGVLVDVDVDVVEGRNIIVAKGDSQLLGGKEATAFATYLGKGESEESRLARFSQVLDQVVQRLPSNRDALIKTLEGVDATGRSTVDVNSLADFLLGYGDQARGGDATYQSLPVDPLETGGPPALVVDPQGLQRLQEGLLSDSLPPDSGGEQISVLVQNGVGTPGLEQQAGKLLRDAGFEFLNGGNANEFGVEHTVILIPDAQAASRSLGQQVAQTLGVPESAVRVSDQGSSVADVIVILGADFGK